MANWKPDAAEAKFLGELLTVDSGLAEIAKNMLQKGHSLDYVVATYKDAVKIAGSLRKVPA